MDMVELETPEGLKKVKGIILVLIVMIPTTITVIMNVESGDWFSLIQGVLVLGLILTSIGVLVLIYSKLYVDPKKFSKIKKKKKKVKKIKKDKT